MVLRTDLVRRLTARAEGSGGDGTASLAEHPEGRLRRETMQRLQLGLSGVATMFLLVGLASVIDHRADMAEVVTVPEAVPETQAPADGIEDDPLVSAGVVPDLPAESPPVSAPSARSSAANRSGDASPAR